MNNDGDLVKKIDYFFDLIKDNNEMLKSICARLDEIKEKSGEPLVQYQEIDWNTFKYDDQYTIER